ncbi:hypothetical protein V8D89_010531 [Ganoderma adspersum]
MVDGESSNLPVSQRLQRLRQYSSNFRNSIFDHEDLAAHPDYVRQFGHLARDYWSCANDSTSALWGCNDRSEFFFSVFTYGSAQAGIQSRCRRISVGTRGAQPRFMDSWAIDSSEDLLATVEQVETGTDEQIRRFLEVRFYLVSGSETTRTDHPAAMVPCVKVFPPPGSEPAAHIFLFTFIIRAHHIIWQLCILKYGVRYYSIEVFNWRTGQIVSWIDFGTWPIDVVPWGDSHLLVTPVDAGSPRYLHIYSISPSIPDRPIHTLQLPEPNLNPGESVVGHQMTTSLHPLVREGHFRADPSRSIILFTHYVRLGDLDTAEYTSHLLIPYTTLCAWVETAIRSADSDFPGPPVPVPWQDWGAHGCLRLRLPHVRGRDERILLVPLGSWVPVVTLDGPSASVYVFDVDPLAARHYLQHDDGRYVHHHPSESSSQGKTPPYR